MNQYDAAKILGISGEITPQSVKKAYRQACKKYHPDRNKGGLEMMKSVNVAYDVLKNFTGRLDHELPNFGDELMAVINALSEYNDIDLELCGSWLWISGNTKEHKEVLKKVKCRWAPKKKLWYFRPADHKSYGRGKYEMDEIRAKHGTQNISKQSRKKIAA